MRMPNPPPERGEERRGPGTGKPPKLQEKARVASRPPEKRSAGEVLPGSIFLPVWCHLGPRVRAGLDGEADARARWFRRHQAPHRPPPMF